MMGSNFMSRFMSSDHPSASIYDQLRQQDEDPDGFDVEQNAALIAGGANRGDDFIDLRRHSSTPQATRLPSRRDPSGPSHAQGLAQSRRSEKSRALHKSRRQTRQSKLLDVEEADDDVPASLLIDHKAQNIDTGSINLPPPPSEISDGQAYGDDNDARYVPTAMVPPRVRPLKGIVGGNLASADPREKAMYRWTNVINLDVFLTDVYDYYKQRGFWSTILSRVFNLLNTAFVVGFSIFLTQCINYRAIKGSTKMSQILVPQCTRRMGFLPNVLLWIITLAWIWNAFTFIRDLPRLYRMHDFYRYLLDVPEQEIQSISWQEIVSRLMALRDSNPTITSKLHKASEFVKTQDKQRMDAHDIANRIMRKDNYMIAMVNKDILDLSLPVPFLRTRKLFSRTLEWNLQLCITELVFDQRGHIRPLFLKDVHRKELSSTLRTRFITYAAASLITAPFLAIFFILKHFFTNFNEYQKNPGQIGMREYTPFAQWKFREFNELEHLFQQRINMSLPFADRYINQFPKDKVIQVARFVSLVSGAIVSVLGLATVLDQDNFLNFEVTPGRTTIFYIGIFGSIWAVARGMLPDDNMVYDTAFSIQEVIQFTHYEPTHWTNRLHTVEVKEEFSQLYQMKLMIFLEEVLSIFFTPFILCFSLTRCCDRIIDFFREFTVHVDGIGYVCTFAEFRFMGQAIRPAPRERTTEANGNAIEPAIAGARAATTNAITNAPANPTALRDDYFASKDNKMEQSYWGFMNDYSRNPRNSGSRRRFNFPPPVPGLPSPSFSPYATHRREDSGGAGGPMLASLASPSLQRPSGTSRSNVPPTQHGQGHSTASERPASPLQSLLLDPHHQPSASGFGTASSHGLRPKKLRTNVHAKLPRHDASDRALDRQGTGLTEEEEDAPPADLQGPSIARQMLIKGKAVSTDPTIDEAGPLGSWKYEVDSVNEDDEDEESDEDALAALQLGPLGLIRRLKDKAASKPGQIGDTGV